MEKKHHKRTRVKEAPQQLKREKALDHGRITSEILTNMGKQGIEMITEISNKAEYTKVC